MVCANFGKSEFDMIKNNQGKFASLFNVGLIVLGIVCLSTQLHAATVWLDDLDISQTTQGWGDPHKNQSVDGHGLSIGGQKFEHGFGTHAESVLYVNLNDGAKSFSASVGVDGEATNTSASIEFFVLGDGKTFGKAA